MSTSSAHNREAGWRVNSQNRGGRTTKESIRRKRPAVDANDAYLYALRVAYLAYLLQPKPKRVVSRTLPTQPLAKSATSSSIQDLMRDFSLVRDKSTRYPRDFINALEKRLQGILMNREQRPEYKNPDVKRSFSGFLNQLLDPSFKKRMEGDRRAEDLVLMFISTATKELQKGKAPGDEDVKRLVDKHITLFVRLLSLILKDKDWAKDKPELASRLQTLESKMMKHAEELASPMVAETQTFEEEIPLSYEVKDMPLVQIVGRVFGLRNSMLQSDIDKHKPEWTERAALQDLKTYQAHLNVGTNRTLGSGDFDTQEAFEDWKKAESPELSQMMLTIVSANPELAKSAPGGKPLEIRAQSNGNSQAYSELSHVISQEPGSPYVSDLPDMNSLNFDDHGTHDADTDLIYTFIPTNPRDMFRFIMKQALTSDLAERIENGSSQLLSKSSTDLLSEIASRWRVPMFSRLTLFLDIIKEKFVESELDLDALDVAFNYAKQPPQEESKHKRSASNLVVKSVFFDRHKWTLADFALMQQILSAIHDSLLRSLYEAMMACYDQKQSPMLGAILTILDEHVRSDPSFSQSSELMDQFRSSIEVSLVSRAKAIYSEAVEKEIPAEQADWEFYHLMQLKKSVTKLCERVQKRYRKSPEIMGVKLQMIFYEAVLPLFAEDSQAIIKQTMESAKEKDQDIPIDEGFDMYKEMSDYRRIFCEALPQKPFPYKIEDILQPFVWRWLKATEDQVVGWVENAVKQDKFAVRTSDPSQVPTEHERHSVSVIDVFQSFNQIINQVAELNWDDDHTYAKFMTSLSKAIGAGITKYCDLLDQMFGREMDRLTPEQIAAQNQTRQERWMQLAKDTWNQKERVEPFNFYAESFVKLNDISFAITQWDKLEHEINVDACAAVIKRYSPPAVQRQRKFSNFVFTIKIVEGEDLKACDVSGYSDPYVVLTDEYQKRLFKTKIVYRNLNPRFDETVDISTQGPLNVIATIWDWDAMGDHDYVGRTSLKLDPSHFGDFLPREYWLDLDTQGRMLVRVSMEGERDDIQFYFAKAFRALQRTQRDMTRKITDKLSAYINHCLSRRALRALLSKGIGNISMSTVSSFLNRNRQSLQPAATGPTESEIMGALTPLFTYFDDNFAIMNQTLTSDAMIAVMTRLWKEVLATIETLLVPPLSDKPSQQKPLTQQELDIVYKWLQSLFDFFHAVDEETGEANGVPLNVLKSPKYHEIQTINFFYFESTENLVRESERMVSATTANTANQRSRLSAPPAFGQQFGGGLLAAGSVPANRRAKSIMVSRNLGTMKKAKEEKWKAAQAEPSDDMILRILRMRPEAGGYLRDRSRQKERLAAAAAAEMIVRQSLAAGSGGRMTGPSVMRR